MFDVAEDFFKDLKEEFQNWEASASQGKPKSLWEELAVRRHSPTLKLQTHNHEHDVYKFFFFNNNRYVYYLNSWYDGNYKNLVCTLQEIGEEFVEFLEKEVNISDEEVDSGNNEEGFKRNISFESSRTDGIDTGVSNEAGKGSSSIEENLDEIEATLAKLKRELGL